MRPSRLALIVGSLATATTVTAAVAALAVPVSAKAGTPPVQTDKGVGIFTERCDYANTAAIDPILMPGQTGMSMQHDFFGSTQVTANSTGASLSGSPTTCSTSADSSGYWTPVLSQNGKPLRPLKTTIYWLALGRDAATVVTMPAGISLIAGDEVATRPQGVRRVAWDCAGPQATSRARTATPQDCPAGSRLRVTIHFPSCWDGHTLDGAKQTNAVYPGRRDTCPSDHLVRIPELVVHVTYPTASAAGLTLSTGPGATGSVDTEHADFLDAFAPAPLAADVARCLKAGIRCGRVSGPLAQPQPVPPADRSHHHRRHRRPHHHAAPAAATSGRPT